MSEACDTLLGRNAQGNRGLFVEMNAQFIKSARDKYAANKDKAEYTGSLSLQKAIPVAVEYTGTVATNVFTVTGVDVTAEFPVGSWVALYEKTAFDTATNMTEYTDYRVYQITDSTFTTDTAVTLDLQGGTLPVTYDTGIPFEDKWQEVYGISDVGFAFESADINVDTNLSGAITTNIPGKITADPSLTGFYMPNIPTQIMLERTMMFPCATVNAIITRGRLTGEVFYQGSFSVKTFTDGGVIDGTAAQSLDGAMQSKVGGSWKEFTADGDFHTAVTIKQY